MLTVIRNLPAPTIGVRASGQVALEDSRALIEPALSSMLAGRRKARLLYIADDDFEGYEAGVPWDDTVFGSRHFSDFERIAFVARLEPYRRAVQALEGLMPTDLRVFAPRDMDMAKAWLAG
jgi:hypothetical protein